MANQPDPDNRYLLGIAREMQQSARSLSALSERLSEGTLQEFVDHLKEVMKSQKLISDVDKDRIKDAKTLSGVLDDLEKQAREVRTLTNSDLKKKKKQFESKVKQKHPADTQRQQKLIERYEEMLLRRQARLNGLSDEYYDALKDNVEMIREEIKSRAQSVGSLERFKREWKGVTDGIKQSTSSFFTLNNAVDLTKKSFFKYYEQMSSLTEKGMLGAIHHINIASLKLAMLPKDLEEIVSRNRDVVNQLGGGMAGLKRFTEYFGEVQKELGHLGPHMKVAAEKFIQLNKISGYKIDMDRKAADASIRLMKEQYEVFSTTFGDTPEQYYNLIASQLEEENIRNRLNSANTKTIGKIQEEILRRTEHLKLLGLSNEQIVKFNEKLQQMYDPRKDNRRQRYEDAIQQMMVYQGTEMALRKSSNPDDRAAAEEMRSNRGAMWKYLRSKMSGNVSERQLQQMKMDPEFIAAQASYSKAAGLLENIGPNMKGYAGFGHGMINQKALEELQGDAFVEAIRKGTAVIPKELEEQVSKMSDPEKIKFLMRSENVEMVKAANRDLLYKNGDDRQGKIEEAAILEKQHQAIVTVTNTLNGSFGTAIGAAVAALGALAVSAWTAAAANAVMSGKKGAGAVISALGSFTGSILKGLKVFGLLAAAITSVYSLWKTKDDYDEGRITDTERNEKYGAAAGGLAGAALGGMAAGAALGTVVPGAGNVVGGAVGLAGGALGYWLGRKGGGMVGKQFGSGERKTVEPAEKEESEQSPTEKQKPRVLKKGADRAVEIADSFMSPSTITGMNVQQTKAYAGNTALTESNGRISAENKYGYIGQYQFGAEALADTGLVDKEKLAIAKRQYGSNWYKGGQTSFLNDQRNWKIEGGKKAFMSDRKLQDDAFVKYTNANIRFGYESGALNEKSTAERIAAYAKAAHLKGAGNATKYFKHGIDSRDANGTRVSDYARGAEASMKDIQWKVSPEISKDGKPVVERTSRREVSGKIKGINDATAPQRDIPSSDTGDSIAEAIRKGTATIPKELESQISKMTEPDKVKFLTRPENIEIVKRANEKRVTTDTDEKDRVKMIRPPVLATPTYVETPQKPFPDMVPKVKMETLPKSAVDDPVKTFTQSMDERMKNLTSSGASQDAIVEELKNMSSTMKIPPMTSVKTPEQRQQETISRQREEEKKRVVETNKPQGDEELLELKKHTDLLTQLVRGMASGRSFANPSHQRDKSTVLNGLG